jgi:hypothetical protein
MLHYCYSHYEQLRHPWKCSELPLRKYCYSPMRNTTSCLRVSGCGCLQNLLQFWNQGHDFSGSAQAMSEHGRLTGAWQFQHSVGLLYWAFFVTGLPIGLAKILLAPSARSGFLLHSFHKILQFIGWSGGFLCLTLALFLTFTDITLNKPLTAFILLSSS